ncbi:hypothetical protein EYC84_002539 [Monilinia fructicola]|uniref:Transcription factor domain-containing protein n=1 Tax=Monilinia fructicola TaxID=38448 RepID=A0A5M9JP87_MONFR|nr:hypothetical protein EYC84_002539 [Monilinia fructicola]
MRATVAVKGNGSVTVHRHAPNVWVTNMNAAFRSIQHQQHTTPVPAPAPAPPPSSAELSDLLRKGGKSSDLPLAIDTELQEPSANSMTEENSKNVPAVNETESIGLHRELDTVVFAVDGSRKVFTPDVLEQRRRVFWVVMSLNRLFAAEYGRSKVSLDNVRCRKPIAKEGDSIGDLIAMSELLSYCTGSGVESDALRVAIENLSILPTNHAGLALIKADIVLCLSRRLHQTCSKFSSSVLSTIMVVLRNAFAESKTLSEKRLPWWNVSISHLPAAIDTLETVSKLWDTHLSREALQTAQMLINRFVEIKREDQGLLESLHRTVDHPSVSSSNQNWTGTFGNDLFEGLNGQDFGWAQFFGDAVH